jgi:hypothetical protein
VLESLTVMGEAMRCRRTRRGCPQYGVPPPTTKVLESNSSFARCAALVLAPSWRSNGPGRTVPSNGSGMTMSVVAVKMRKWTVLGVAPVMILAASVAFGEAPTACEVAYLTSGPTVHQMSFEGPCDLYGATPALDISA